MAGRNTTAAALRNSTNYSRSDSLAFAQGAMHQSQLGAKDLRRSTAAEALQYDDPAA